MYDLGCKDRQFINLNYAHYEYKEPSSFILTTSDLKEITLIFLKYNIKALNNAQLLSQKDTTLCCTYCDWH